LRKIVSLLGFAGGVQGNPAAMLALPAAVLNEPTFVKDGVNPGLFDG
jgi:hypothetical protein